jgi:hypothetical protein
VAWFDKYLKPAAAKCISVKANLPQSALLEVARALAILNETPGVEVEIVEYLKTPPSREELKRSMRAPG